MNIDRIEKLYGKDTLELIEENIEDVYVNCECLKSFNLFYVDEIFEKYAPGFICEPIDFYNKVKKIITSLGDNYIDILKEDLSYFEVLL